MPVHVQKGPRSLCIRITGRFDFACHSEFRAAYNSTPDCMQYDVDMGEVAYMDSAALGMLLLLRDHAAASGAAVALINCKGQPSEVLKIANFDKLFKMS